LDKEQLTARTKNNLCALYRVLFDLKKQQRLEEGGEHGEILEYTKSYWSVDLPKPKVVLPREKPIPKPKPLTKWEKFRLERGITEKAKRSRMVFDPITQDWVPRYGMGSIKKIEDKHTWLMEEKGKHVAAGTDPFTFKKQEKKLQKEKQELRELKNKISANEPAGGKKTNMMEQVLPDSSAKKDDKPNLKQREDVERERVRKRERKALMKSLQLAQVSTASMGKFDKKVNKHEPDAPKS